MDLRARVVAWLGASLLLLPGAGSAEQASEEAAELGSLAARLQRAIPAQPSPPPPPPARPAPAPAPAPAQPPPGAQASPAAPAAPLDRVTAKEAAPALEGANDDSLFTAAVMGAYFPDRDRMLAAAREAAGQLDGRALTTDERGRAQQAVFAYNLARTSALERMRSDAFGPAAVVVSGGTSLGAYEAGLLYYYTYIQAQWAALEATRTLRPGEDPPRQFQVATGTSAGAINAFLAAMAACRAPEPDPEKSLFSIWKKVDWNDLREGVDDNQCGYLGGALKRTRIREVMREVVDTFRSRQGWVPCNVAFGLAVTNVVPRQVPLSRDGGWGHSSLAISRLTERFVVRLVVGKTGPPRLTAVRGAELDLADEFLPVLGDGSTSSSADPATLTPDQVTSLLLASSGIPGVFDPIRLEYTVDEGQGPRYHSGCFMDGGVLDNVPLSTAIRLAEHARPAPGQAPAPTPSWGKPLSPFYLYVDPDNVEGPVAPLREPGSKLGPALGTLLGNLVRGARQAELVRTMEEAPEARLRLRLPGRKHVITGELLSAFGAFLDRSFRNFDYLAGMADAQRALRGSVFYEEVRRKERDRVASPAFACFEEVWAAPGAVESSPACLALRDSTCTSPDRCGASERDLWRLLKTSVALDQRRDDPDLTLLFFEELSSSTGAKIDGVARPGYEYLTLRLAGHVARPQEGREAAREQLQKLVAGVARSSNDWLLRPAIDTAGSPLLDGVLGYSRVGVTWWLGLLGHGPEAGYSRRLWRLPLDAIGELQLADLRFAPAIKTGRLADLRARVGLRGELVLSPVFQLQGSTSIGYQAIWLHGYQPVYRPNWSLRGDLQILQRIYFTLAWARGLGQTHPVEPRSDLNFGLGVRWWLD